MFGDDSLSGSNEEIYEHIWHRIALAIRRAKQNEALRTTITSSAILFESGQTHRIPAHQSHSGHLLGEFYDNDNRIGYNDTNIDRKVASKSVSLSRITGKTFKRNLLAIDAKKSISNEFLNSTTAFDIEQSFECNNNKNTDGGGDGGNPNTTAAGALLTAATYSSAPCFGEKLDKDDMRLVRDYLTKAFKNQYHPLGVLNAKISYCFYTSYGCWKVKPNEILSTQAMKEWESISKRFYDIVRRMFPSLPPNFANFDEYE